MEGEHIQLLDTDSANIHPNPAPVRRRTKAKTRKNNSSDTKSQNRRSDGNQEVGLLRLGGWLQLKKDPSIPSRFKPPSPGINRVPTGAKIRVLVSYIRRRLKVYIYECKKLSFVMVQLRPDSGTKRTTFTEKGTSAPQFNTTFTYNGLSIDDLTSRELWISVWHKRSIYRNRRLGEVVMKFERTNQESCGLRIRSH